MDRTIERPKFFSAVHIRIAFVLTMLTELALAFIFTLSSGLPFYVVIGYLNQMFMYHVLHVCLFIFSWLTTFIYQVLV